MRVSGISAVAVGALAGLAVGPTVELARDEVDIPIPPDEVLDELRRRFAASPGDILVLEHDRLVRRFAGRAGPFPYRTVELVVYEPEAITFEHLAGPFARCHERFELAPTPGGTRVAHTGRYRLRGGLWSAPLALGPVRWAFEAHVGGHLRALADELAPEIN